MLPFDVLSTLLLLCSAPVALANPLPAKHSQPCPKEFNLYLGPGNDAQNRTWYFRGFIADGRATQLSAFPDFATTYTLLGNRLVYAANKTLYANTPKADTNPITFVSDHTKLTNKDYANFRPFEASMDHKTCEVTLEYKNKTVYQRYGFYLNLTPPQQNYTGQIQWFNKPVAVAPDVDPDNSASTSNARILSTGSKPDWFYYMEDAQGRYVGRQ